MAARTRDSEKTWVPLSLVAALAWLGGCADDGLTTDDEAGDTGEVGDGLGPGGPGCDQNWVALDGEAPPAPEAMPPEFQPMAMAESAGVVDASSFGPGPLTLSPPPRPARQPLDLDWGQFVEAYAEPWPGGWMIDGDQFVTTRQLRDLHHLLTGSGTGSETGLPALNGGVFDEVWSEPRKLALTWCVGFVFPQPNDEDNTEKHEERYERILSGMEHSTKAWERATGVNFVHLAEFDDPASGVGSGSCQPGQDGIMFRVRMAVGEECKGACAGRTTATPITEFDPAWASPENPDGFERELLFGVRALHSDREMQITARHELGHVLGFAHEHLAFDQDECSEDDITWRSLTAPDPSSIMADAWCPGAAPDRPRLSGFDRLGAFYQYHRARRNPLMMGGGSLNHDFSYDGSDRPAIAWFTPLERSIQQWTSTAAPGQAIAFDPVERCLDGQAPPCGPVESAVALRPSPLHAAGSNRELDLLLLDSAAGLADTLIYNDGADFSLASFAGPDHMVPIIGAFGNEIDDQIIIYRPGPAADTLFDPESGALVPLDYADYAFPIPGRFRGFGGGGNDILWYQPDAQTVEFWQWAQIPEFSFNRQGPIPTQDIEFEPDGEYMPLVGDFNGDDRTDVFWYAPGDATDWLWLSISTPETVLFDRFERQVTSGFRPLVGDFDGDGIDDIFWYAARAESPDTLSVIWAFDDDGGHTPRTFSINGDYAPVVGDFDDDGCSDILWHDPASPDRLSPVWRCIGGGAFACDAPIEAPEDGFPIGSGLYG